MSKNSKNITENKSEKKNITITKKTSNGVNNNNNSNNSTNKNKGIAYNKNKSLKCIESDDECEDDNVDNKSENDNASVCSENSNESDDSNKSEASDYSDQSVGSDGSDKSDESNKSDDSNESKYFEIIKNPKENFDDNLSNEDILRNFLFERLFCGIDDFNILLTGKVSSGKTMLLNALLGDLYSESKIQKTTKGISFYATNCENSMDRERIFKLNKSIEINSETKTIPFNIFELGQINITNQTNFQNIKKNINIFDTVGIDDPNIAIDKMTHKWIKKNSSYIDVFVVVIDIRSALNTKSDTVKLEQTIANCRGHIIFAVNKFDDMENDELNELYTEFVCQINNLMENNERVNYDVCRISALNQYIMQLIQLNKIDRLTPNEKKMGQIITTSGFDDLYKCFNNLMKLHTQKQRILKFIKTDIVRDRDTLFKLFIILNKFSAIDFDENQNCILMEYIYKSISQTFSNDDNQLCYDEIGVLFPNLNKNYNVVINLKKMKINEFFSNSRKGENFLENLISFIGNTKDPTEKNTLLNLVFNKEINSILILNQSGETLSGKNKSTKQNKNYYGSNTDHYDHLFKYSKLICSDGDLKCARETLNTYIKLLVISNMLCSTVSAKISETNKQLSKKIFKGLLLLLIATTNTYAEIFSSYKELTKLQYIDCEIGNSVEIPENILLDLDMDNISNQFEYFNEIKRVSNFLKIFKLI